MQGRFVVGCGLSPLLTMNLVNKEENYSDILKSGCVLSYYSWPDIFDQVYIIQFTNNSPINRLIFEWKKRT